jgi:hypothetical protein
MEGYEFMLPEKRVLREMFGPGWGEVTRGWRELTARDFTRLSYPLPFIIKANTSRRMRWA